MRKVTLTNCKRGDILARPIVANSGVILAGEGTELTLRLIDRFSGSGIDAIWIDGDEILDPAEVEEKKSKIIHRFSRIGNDPFLKEMEKLMIQSLENRGGKTDATD
jgi:hypothetical protein